jgi:hypothetical protein
MNCQKIKYAESKNELQSRIDEHLNYLYTFYINSRKSSFLYDNLDNPKTQEEKDIMWKDHILNEIKFLLIKNQILELAKAFNVLKSYDCFTISKLLCLIKENSLHFESIYCLESFESELQVHKKPIEDVILLRKKLYAHSDSDFDSNLISITKIEIRNLISLLGRLIKNLSTKFSSSDFLVENEIPKPNINFLEDIALGRRIRLDESNPFINRKS